MMPPATPPIIYRIITSLLPHHPALPPQSQAAQFESNAMCPVASELQVWHIIPSLETCHANI